MVSLRNLLRMSTKGRILGVIINILAVCIAESTKPDLTFLAGFNSGFTCVAGRNLDTSAIYFSTDQTIGNTASVYLIPNGKQVNKSFNCRFEINEKCIAVWAKNPHKIVSYGTHNIAPALDERWEALALQYTNGARSVITIALNGSRNIIVSVSAEDEAHILLCTSEQHNGRLCYWFILLGTGVEVKKCENVAVDNIKKNYPKCVSLNKTDTMDKGSGYEWEHFFMAINSGYIKIMQYLTGNVNIIVSYDNENLTDMFLTSFDKDAKWKINSDSYLSLKLNKTFSAVGATGTTKSDGELCISLYATLCSTCKLDINIHQLKETQMSITGEQLTDSNTELQRWTNLKLKGNFSKGTEFQLYLKGRNYDDRNEEFWAIDQLRECHKNEIRLLNRTVNSRPHYMYCKSLQFPKWRSGISFQNLPLLQPSETKFCSDARNIGADCNISCSMFDEYCGQRILCQPTSSEMSECTCTAGYSGVTCKEACKDNHYGFNCKKTCGRCEGGLCLKTNGSCQNGCEHGFGPDETCFKRILPILTKPVKVIDTTLSTIIVQIADISKEGTDTPDHFQMQYKVSTEENWTFAGEKSSLKQFSNITLKNLRMETSYNIRAILFVKDDCYEGKDIPFTEAITSCPANTKSSVGIKNITVMPEQTHIQTKWIPVCKQRYQLTLTCKMNDWCNNTPHNQLIDSVSGHVTVTGLNPFTSYAVEIFDNNLGRTGKSANMAPIYLQDIQTAPGAPGIVRDFTVYSKDEKYISVRWGPPYPPNGELDYYLLAYSLCNQSLPEFTKIQHVKCDIWPDYSCYTISDITAKHCYQISIKAKNKNVVPLGLHYKFENIYSYQAPSKPPESLSSAWENDELVLTWKHPNITNGDLQNFFVTIYRNYTELKAITFNVKQFEINITKPQGTYSYKFSESMILWSSRLYITVSGTNSYQGEKSNLTVDTPPSKPSLLGIIKSKVRTSTTQVIEIAGVNSAVQTQNNFAYVVVCSSSKTSEIKLDHPLKSEILNQTSCNGFYWIAAELKLNETLQIFTVGDNSTIRSEKLGDNLRNRPLTSTDNYVIYVVLINEYNDQRRYTAYFANTGEVSEDEGTLSNFNPVFFALLLLLLLPVIGFFIYRYRKNYGSIVNWSIGGTSSVTRNFNAVPINEAGVAMSPLRPLSKNSKTENVNDGKQPLLQSEENQRNSRLVKLNNFSKYVKEALETGLLQQQHERFPKGPIKSWEYGMVQQNKFKNRYNNISAYDENRVKLSKMRGDEYSDFINASYIDGYQHSKAYIATQGPKPSTLNDFWRMIWQEKVLYIVMLANTTEGGKRKCEQYWPDINSSRQFIDIEVNFIKSEIFADFEYRTFSVIKGEETRRVQHLHFTSWPDHGVPLYPQSLVPFLKKMLTISTGTAPIVVHCSAGVGRTGTIILSDICLRMAAKERAVDVLKYLSEIRQQRSNMVDNIDQYTLVHLVLLECLLSPDTNIPCDDKLYDLVDKLIRENGIQRQMAFLEDTAWHDKMVNTDSMTHLQAENKVKNRNQDITPERNRIYLSRYPTTDEHSDYINAVPVDGFRIKKQFIVTQLPLPNTIGDFWRMIQENNVKVIVSLNEIIPTDQTSCIFWPTEDNDLNPVPYIGLKYKSVRIGDNYDLYNIHMDTCETEEENSDLKIVHILQCKLWNPDQDLPQNPEYLLQLIEEAQNLSRHGNPMVVACNDGTNASGIFVALSFVIEKIKLEQKCDVCLAVRVVRRNRKQFIKNEKQFEFLYKAAVAYVGFFETYSNFQLINKK